MDDVLNECYKLKEQISLRYNSASELAAAARHLAKTDPLPPPGLHRKPIPGIPPHLSVSDDDQVTAELRKVKEKLSDELYKKRLTKKTSHPAGTKKPSPKPSSFRSTKNHRNPKP